MCANNRETGGVREREKRGGVPADGAAGIALGRAGVWGQRHQRLSNVRVRMNEHCLFDSVEHSRAQQRRRSGGLPRLRHNTTRAQQAMCSGEGAFLRLQCNTPMPRSENESDFKQSKKV